MKAAYLPAVSLALALGAPVYAQQPQSPPGTTIGSTGLQQAPSTDQIKDRLGKAGVEDRKEFKGRLVRAASPEGHPVLLVIGPENMEGNKSLDNFSEDKIRGQLVRSGFRDIAFVQDPNLMRGKMDGDRAVLALAGDSGWRGSPGAATGRTPNRDRLTTDLEKVGLRDREELKGKLVRAQGPDGQTMLLVLGPEDFKGGKSVDFSAGELTKFQQSGFRSAEVVQDVTLMRGKMDDMAVIALAGQALTGSTSTMGAGSGTAPAGR